MLTYMDSKSQAPDADSQGRDPASRIEHALAALRRRSMRGPGAGRRGSRGNDGDGGDEQRGGPFGGGPFAGGPFPGGPFQPGTFPGGPFGTGAFGRNPFGWGTSGQVGADETGPAAAAATPNSDHAGEGEPNAGRGQSHGWRGGLHPGHGGPHWGHGDAGPGGFARFRALEALESGPRTVTELAELIGVDQPRASRLVAFGVKAGLVRKAQDPADARRAIVELTDAGRQAIAAARDRRQSSLQRGLASFTPDEAEQFATYLERFVAGWGSAD